MAEHGVLVYASKEGGADWRCGRWAAHGAGSACGKPLGDVPASTVGYELRTNRSIKAASDEQAFVDFILAGQPEPPLYFARMKRDNRRGPEPLPV